MIKPKDMKTVEQAEKDKQAEQERKIGAAISLIDKAIVDSWDPETQQGTFSVDKGSILHKLLSDDKVRNEVLRRYEDYWTVSGTFGNYIYDGLKETYIFRPKGKSKC